MDPRLAELSRRYQRKVTLIGWSLGGVFACEMARGRDDFGSWGGSRDPSIGE
jgi:hypothetical protein